MTGLHWLMADPARMLAVLGTLGWAGTTAIMAGYGSRHYTRIPGGKWTTWENANGWRGGQDVSGQVAGDEETEVA